MWLTRVLVLAVLECLAEPCDRIQCLSWDRKSAQLYGLQASCGGCSKDEGQQKKAEQLREAQELNALEILKMAVPGD
ncbi:hypothetical protein NDU88_000507 [Pleurodeles waltl]|uniref:Uncharacterized protein n=1 Tax=Pleurodeles waltl TaxID=8319 RepID=A0AAV7UR93_PLEWA|nr:hypothetical protein NDU88_000507 [Pleurodeles waltl]